MAIPAALLIALGKPVADRLMKGLLDKKDGAQKLEQAAAAMSQGLSAIEALKQTFGKDFLTSLNEGLGTSASSKFTYEAGTQSYIKLTDPQSAPIKVLRDELNINLDRLSVLEGKAADRRNHFLGLMSIWQDRVRQHYGGLHTDDIKSTFALINDLLKGETKNYKQIYHLLSSTSLGGVGALMLISGVFIATGTGVGVVSAITMFFVGIPWLTVGALVIPGTLLVVLAAKKTRPADDISLSIAIAYKLLERLEPV